MTEEIDRWERNIARVESIIKDIEKKALSEKDEIKFKALEKKLQHFQDYKKSLETWLSIIKGEK